MPNWLLTDYGQELRPQGIAVYSALVMHSRNGTCFPGHERIMEVTGIKSDRTVKDEIKKLETLGLITKRRRRGADGKQTSNLYRLTFPVAKSAKSRSRRYEVPTNNTYRALPCTGVNERVLPDGSTEREAAAAREYEGCELPF